MSGMLFRRSGFFRVFCVPTDRREDPQGRTALPEVQLLAVLLRFHQDADGFFRLPHQVQVHFLIAKAGVPLAGQTSTGGKVPPSFPL